MYIKNNKINIGRASQFLSILLAVIPVCLVIGFLPSPGILYILVLAITAISSFFYKKKILNVGIILIFICTFSIIFGEPNPLFHSWIRLGYFCLLLFAVFPVFQSKTFIIIREYSLKYVLMILSALSVGSIICFPLGINFMTRGDMELGDQYFLNVGWYGGLFSHSMLLGVLSAISSISLFWIATAQKKKKKRVFLFICSFMALCSVMVSGSRGAAISIIAAFLITLFLKNKDKLSKTLNIIFKITIILVVLYPIYAPFADRVLEKQRNNIEGGGSAFSSRGDRWDNRIEEFQDNIILGCGFSAMYVNGRETEYDRETGVCEPGSSWLATLSMTGIAGFICITYIFYHSLKNAIRLRHHNYKGYLYIGLLSVFIFHMMVEGYIYAAGNFMCFLLWLVLGCSYSIPYNNYPNYKTLKK